MSHRSLLIFIIALSGVFLFFFSAKAGCVEGQIDLNLVTQEELEQIVGIGPTYAERIIETRPFETLTDLLNVKGIGEKTLEKIKEQGLACVDAVDIKTDFPSQTDDPDSLVDEQNEEILPGNLPPIADAGENIVTNVGMMIQFDAAASYDPEGTELLCVWNLGNGELRDDCQFSYSYQYAGKYIATLEVSDRHLISTDSIIIDVYPQAVYLSEVLPNPVGSDAEGEWIEIANYSEDIVNLSGWQIDDEEGGSKPFTLPEHTYVLGNSFLLIERRLSGIALNNDKDEVRLLYPSGEVADALFYEKAQEGLAAARRGEEFLWTEIVTPGMENLIYLSEISSKPSFYESQDVRAESFQAAQNIFSEKENSPLWQATPQKQELFQNKNGVRRPLLSELDDFFKIKSALAESKIKGLEKIGGIDFSGKGANNLLKPEEGTKTIFLLPRKIFKPEIVLALSTLSSSILLAYWVIIIKKRYLN